jgi:hypothetical protein
MLAAQANAATGKINEALTGAHHAAAIAKRLNDTGTFADAALLRDRLLLDLFDNAAVAAGSKELIAVLQLSNSPAKLSTALSNWACAERALGNEAAAAQAAADAERVVIDTGDEDAACYALVQKILTAITWWHFSEAAGAAERVSAIAPHAGAVARAAVSCALGSFHLAANQYTEARSAIDTARVLVQEAHELFVPAQWRPFRLSAIILGLESACARLALTRDDARGALDAAGRLLLIGSSRSRALAFAFGADAFFLSGDRRMLADRTMRDRAHESFSQDVDSGSRSVQFAYTLIAAATAAPDARRHVRESLDMLEDAAQRTPLEADLAFARLARAAELCGAEHVARRAALRCRDYGAARMLAVSRIAGATAVLPKNT